MFCIIFVLLVRFLIRPTFLFEPYSNPLSWICSCSESFTFSTSLISFNFLAIRIVLRFIRTQIRYLFIPLKGIPNNFNNSLASSSVSAVVITDTFIPFTKSTSSYVISGNNACSFKPNV